MATCAGSVAPMASRWWYVAALGVELQPFATWVLLSLPMCPAGGYVDDLRGGPGSFVLGIIDKNKGVIAAPHLLVNSLGRIDGQKQENGCELCGRGKPIPLRAEESACYNDADGPVILAQEQLQKIN
nr:hypothetical protein Iba_chr11aCG7220 [Ipomoea batatas]GMD51887.1 hypothetical protein Iba_chr11bCG6610 [Ipomoea batatas]